MQIVSIPYPNDSPLHISVMPDEGHGYKFSFHVGSCKGETSKQVLRRIAADILERIPA